MRTVTWYNVFGQMFESEYLSAFQHHGEWHYVVEYENRLRVVYPHERAVGRVG